MSGSGSGSSATPPTPPTLSALYDAAPPMRKFRVHVHNEDLSTADVEVEAQQVSYGDCGLLIFSIFTIEENPLGVRMEIIRMFAPGIWTDVEEIGREVKSSQSSPGLIPHILH